ncbi:MAG: acetyl-CoA carboxylase, carboxyltransferase subunit beta, partial [Planctomycetales bacterium]|nr:acetyl-CoA carboxylase, carboxyltransferase subunit beta [Planctomycetales bacterium]
MSWNFPFTRRKKEMPSGLWMRCEGCQGMVFKQAVAEKHQVCPECGHHFTLGAPERIALLTDPGTFREFDAEIEGSDPLAFVAAKSYRDKLEKARAGTGMRDAAVSGDAAVEGVPIVLTVVDARFIQGSMGSAVGEKIARAAERATEKMVPFVLVSGSGGGARMEEGALSLMQMAKCSAALARLHEAGGLFVGILTHATMGGSMASWASLGDVILAEPKALLGFTGPRVIEQTIGKELPPGFQRSEFLLEHGFVDAIVPRGEMKATLAKILRYLAPNGKPRGWAAERPRRVALAAADAYADPLPAVASVPSEGANGGNGGG